VIQNENNNNYQAIDRMINEGLGGGLILYDYDPRKLEEPEKETNLIGALTVDQWNRPSGPLRTTTPVLADLV